MYPGRQLSLPLDSSINKLENDDAPQNAVLKNIKSDILNGFTQRRNDEGGFKVTSIKTSQML